MNRPARFRSGLAYVRNPSDRNPIVAERSLGGQLCGSAGAERIGYDPLFLHDCGTARPGQLHERKKSPREKKKKPKKKKEKKHMKPKNNGPQERKPPAPPPPSHPPPPPPRGKKRKKRNKPPPKAKPSLSPGRGVAPTWSLFSTQHGNKIVTVSRAAAADHLCPDAVVRRKGPYGEFNAQVAPIRCRRTVTSIVCLEIGLALMLPPNKVQSIFCRLGTPDLFSPGASERFILGCQLAFPWQEY